MTKRFRQFLACLFIAALILAGAACSGGEKTADAAAADGATPGGSAPAAPGGIGEATGAAPSTPAGSPGQAPVTEPPATTAPGSPPAGAAPGSAAPGSPLTPSGPPAQVVAKVNSAPITRGQLDFTVKNIAGGNQDVPPDQYDAFRRRVLDEMIDRELIYQKAVASNVSVSDAELAAPMAKVRSNFPDQKTFEAELAKDGMSPSGLETIIRRAMVIDKYVRAEVVPKVKIAPAEETKFYEENKEKMKRPETVHASHILLRTEKGATAEQRVAQKAKADEALARARKGEDFAALAKEYSQDQGSAQRGGDLGTFPKGQMVPPFDAAAFSLKAGEISGIVETDFGYHIIKVAEHTPAGYRSLDEVRPQINEYLSMQRTQGELQKLSQSLRSAAKIEVTL